MSLLELQAVGKRFGGLKALDDVSFTIDSGEMVGLMGANGAGKTTLFSLVAGNERPSAGEIRLDGRSLVGRRADQVAARGIARTFQIVRPFRGLTVRENARIGALFGSAERRPDAADEFALSILADVGLADRADALAGSLTLAGQKRLEIARALAQRPRLLLLDEVMAGLTPTEIADAMAMIRRIKEKHGLTVLVIEHVMSALMDLCQRIIVLHHGMKIAEGTPQAIARDPRVLDAYLGVEA
ncbi:ABC transporter ATP-binding protein [Hypericibacter terrae]|jgi:branched-chain amino acid transport system ATP-binding protein|uniref:ABC transporter ATP-binding protein n=1 Tax=Hypericibacter terrae TaxID=2602015 RepID=A0A5J6MGK1_9PROT|nr:ABC transporter ATP-binding protein [Hypericibacter terrae]QEX16583.1 ABC transporter ATP-binding protein [Hypericibacter terrae]